MLEQMYHVQKLQEYVLERIQKEHDQNILVTYNNVRPFLRGDRSEPRILEAILVGCRDTAQAEHAKCMCLLPLDTSEFARSVIAIYKKQIAEYEKMLGLLLGKPDEVKLEETREEEVASV